MSLITWGLTGRKGTQNRRNTGNLFQTFIHPSFCRIWLHGGRCRFYPGCGRCRSGVCRPSSRVIRKAGSKDEAKQLARKLGVSVTPGEDRICALTLIRKAGENPLEQFKTWIQQHQLLLSKQFESKTLEEQADELIQAASSMQIELISIKKSSRKHKFNLENYGRNSLGGESV